MPLAPIDNYILSLPNPQDQLQKNLEFATGVVQAQRQAALAPLVQQEAQMKLDQAQLVAQQQQQMRQDFATYAQNPTPEGATRLSALYPTMSEGIKRTHDMQSEDEQKARLSKYNQMFSALNSGAPDVASNLAGEWSSALKNSNRPDDAKELQYLSDLSAKNPTAAKAAIGIKLASLDPQFANNFKTMSLLPGEQEKQAADVKTAQSTASFADRQNAATLAGTKATTGSTNATAASTRQQTAERTDLAPGNMEQQKATLEGTKATTEKTKSEMGALPADSQAVIKTAAGDLQTARDTAAKATGLANRIDQVKGAMPAGALASAAEAAKKFTGREDGYSQIRNLYNQLINEKTLAMLAHVRMTEQEVALIKGGFPGTTANPEQMSAAVRLIAKAANLQQDTSRLQIQWASQNGKQGLGALTSPLTIGGVKYDKGATFDEAIDGLSKKYDAPAPAARPAHQMTAHERAAERAAILARAR